MGRTARTKTAQLRPGSTQATLTALALTMPPSHTEEPTSHDQANRETKPPRTRRAAQRERR